MGYYVLTEDAAVKLRKLLGDSALVEVRADATRAAPRQPVADPVQFVRVTDDEPDDGTYTGYWQKYLAGDDTWEDGGECRVREAAGGTLAAGKVLARRYGLDADGCPVFVAVAGGGSLTVKEADGTPTATGVTTIKVAQSYGLYMTDDGSGAVTIGGAGATKTTQGIITTSAQTMGNGEKTFVSGVFMATDSSDVPCVYVTGLSSSTDTFGDGDTRRAILYTWNGLTYKNDLSLMAGGLSLGNGVYAIGSTKGLNTTVTIPKLTSGGANGSITVSGGIVTGYTAPT